jgi:hypothetical protein
VELEVQVTSLHLTTGNTTTLINQVTQKDQGTIYSNRQIVAKLQLEQLQQELAYQLQLSLSLAPFV